MGNKNQPSAPAPIDTGALIQQMSVADRSNQTGPGGSINWTQGPNGQWSQTSSLSGPQAGLLNQSQLLGSQALANLKSGTQNLQYGVNAPTLQTSVTNPGVPVTSLGSAGSIQRNVDGTPIQGSLNTAGVQGIPQANNAAYQKAVDSVYNQSASRLDPQWAQQQTELQTQLANQGVAQNSDAWNKAMTQFTQGKNDAYTSAENNAITQGSQVEQNLFGMGLQANQAGEANALNAGNFANSAQGQGFAEGLSNAGLNNAGQQQKFNENLGSGTFANSAAGQQLAQALSTAGFGNSAQEQMFANGLQNAGLNNSTINQANQTHLAEAGLPNQFLGLNLPGTGQNPDVLGAQSLNAQQQLAAYQAQTAQNSAAKGGIGSLIGTLGGAAILSDRRMKRDIKVIGRAQNGLPIYSFRYAWDTKRQTGLMAQDVERTRPHAVVTIGGIKHVDYGQALAA